MKKMIIFLAISCLAVPLAFAAQDLKISDSRQGKKAIATKTAWVDMNKIFTERLEEGPEEFKDNVQELQKDLNDRFVKIKKEKDSYDKQAAEVQKAPEKASSSKMEDLRKMRANLELEMQSAQDYQMRVFQEMQAEYFPKIQKAAEVVAKRQGWDAVDFAPKLYISPEVDITADVIAELNKEYRAQKAAKKFKKD